MNLKIVLQIYRSNKILFFKKLSIKSLKIFFSLFYLPISIIFLLLMFVIRPFIVIRIGIIPSSRIHHFAVNTELFLLKNKNKNKKTIDIFYCENFISNKFLKKKWKEKIYIGNKFLFSQINFLVSIFFFVIVPILKTK